MVEPRSTALQADILPIEPQGKPKNTGVGSLSLLKGSFLTQELNWGLLHCRQILYQLSYEGCPLIHQGHMLHMLWWTTLASVLQAMKYFSLLVAYLSIWLGAEHTLPAMYACVYETSQNCYVIFIKICQATQLPMLTVDLPDRICILLVAIGSFYTDFLLLVIPSQSPFVNSSNNFYSLE